MRKFLEKSILIFGIYIFLIITFPQISWGIPPISEDIIISFKSIPTQKQIDSIEKSLGLEYIDSLKYSNTYLFTKTSQEPQSSIQTIRNQNVVLKALENTLTTQNTSQLPIHNIQSISKSTIFEVTTNPLDIVNPNDPNFRARNQWYLNNAGFEYLPGKNGIKDQDIDMQEAWWHTYLDTRGRGKKVTIAVIDTGIDYTHEDLKRINTKDMINIGAKYAQQSPLYAEYKNASIYDAMDDHGHGTLVSGTIIAEQNNAKGIAGICNICEILPIKVTTSRGHASEFAIEKALEYANEQKVDAINISLASTAKASSASFEPLLNNLYKNGTLIFSSAGNLNSNVPHYPASYPSVINVASVNANGIKAGHSSFGNTVEISAPGEDIISTGLNRYHNKYIYVSGTSMASPIATGIAGFIMGYYPNMSAHEVRTLLKTTSEPIYTNTSRIQIDTRMGAGLINANNAILKL